MDGTTAVVTGATKGIGRAVAHACAEEGAHVVLCARNSDDVRTVVDAIEDDGGEATGLRADIRDEFDAERLMETASRVGDDGIDIVFACAGVFHGSPGYEPIQTESYSRYDDHLRTNGRGVFATIKEAIPHLTADARVVVPTGAVAREPTEGMGSYAVSKATAEAIVRAFAVDTDATIGCVDPGQVATDLSGGTGRDPGDVAPMFLWAATDADREELNGSVLGLRDWKMATR